MPAPRMIVVGASAGGIQALKQIVSVLPTDFGASVLVVIHVAAQDGQLAELLDRWSPLPVVAAKHNMAIDQGWIYVAPPDHHLMVRDSRLVLSQGPKVNRARPAIDPLFETAARERGKQVLGIVLTGYLDDGTAGLAAVKAHGGITVVQDPEEAVAPNMPRNALQRVKVDYCLPLAQIAPLLVRLVNGTAPNRRKRKS